MRPKSKETRREISLQDKSSLDLSGAVDTLRSEGLLPSSSARPAVIDLQEDAASPVPEIEPDRERQKVEKERN